MTQNRPGPGEYAPYFEKYIAIVPQGELTSILESQLADWSRLLSNLPEKDGDFRYADGKWSIKESIGHVSDAERIFAYRALRIARGDQTPLAGFEQDNYIGTGKFSARSLAGLLQELASVRQGSLSLLGSLDEEAWMRQGVAGQNAISVRALGCIIAGHELHHQRILKEKYLGPLQR